MHRAHISTVAACVVDLLGSVSELQSAGLDAGPHNDVCDIGVARVIVAAVGEGGASVGDMRRSGEFFQFVGNAMNDHDFVQTLDSEACVISWRYVSLFYRTLAITFGEVVADQRGSNAAADSVVPGMDLFRAPGVLVAVAATVSADAVERMRSAIELSAVLDVPAPDVRDEWADQMVASYCQPSDRSDS